MRSYPLHARAGSTLELLEPRFLRAGDVGPLPDRAESEVAVEVYDPAADLDYAHNTLGLTGFGQTVAVIDSGIAYDHFALGGGLGTSYRVVGGWDFAENDPDPYDDGPVGFHGTHVAGILASSAKTALGLAPQVDLVALRVFDDAGRGDFDWIESALAWVHDHRDSFENPITTVNLSVGGSWNAEDVPKWSDLEDELEDLADAGIFVAVAAGNDFADYGVEGLNYPAASPHVVPVASVGEDGELSSFTQRHARALAAPGEGINSTVPDFLYGFDGVTDDFARLSGTSMATPYVAGASVLVREAFARAGRDDVSAGEVYQHLYDTAVPITDPLTDATYQRVNLQAALASILAARPMLSNEVASLGAVARAAVPLPADHHWFEFTAAEDGVMAVSDEANDGALLGTIEVFDGATEVRGHRGNGQLLFSVEHGVAYQLHVADPGEFSRLRLNQVIAVGNDRLEIHGDQTAGEIVVQIGHSFAVVVDGAYERIQLNGRLRGRADEVIFSSSDNGVVVQLPARDSVLAAYGSRGEGYGQRVPAAPMSESAAIFVVVAANAESRFSELLSPLAADASFAADNPTTGDESLRSPVAGKALPVGESRHRVVDVNYSAHAMTRLEAEDSCPWFTLKEHLADGLLEDPVMASEHNLIDQALRVGSFTD